MKKKKKLSPEKNFGILFFVIFFLYGIWPVLSSNEPRFWSIIIGIIFLIITLFYSKALIPLNMAWIKFGELLGKIVSPIVMAFIYFIIITPIAVIVRLAGKDLLKIKLNTKSTYWISRKKNIGSMKKQF